MNITKETVVMVIHATTKFIILMNLNTIFNMTKFYEMEYYADIMYFLMSTFLLVIFNKDIKVIITWIFSIEAVMSTCLIPIGLFYGNITSFMIFIVFYRLLLILILCGFYKLNLIENDDGDEYINQRYTPI